MFLPDVAKNTSVAGALAQSPLGTRLPRSSYLLYLTYRKGAAGKNGGERQQERLEIWETLGPVTVATAKISSGSMLFSS